MRIILFFALSIALFACKKEVETPKQTEKVQVVLKIAIIGDQTTLGINMKNAEQDAYPVQLQTLLGENYILKTFAVEDATVLRKGDRPIWQDTLFQDAQDFQPDIVIFHLGWNDTKIKNWWQYGNEFITDYSEMVDTFAALNSKPRILLCRPLRIFDTVDSINDSTLVVGILPNIDSIVAWNKLETVDLYRILKHRGDLLKQGVYPDRTACRIIAETIYDEIVNLY